MNRVSYRILPLMILLVMMLVMFLSGCGTMIKTAPVAGAKAPEVKGHTIDGQQISLEAYKGKKVFLTFWQAQSPPSIRELSALQEIHNKHDQDVVVIAINLGESSQEVNDLLNEKNLNLPVIIDDKNKTLANLYKIDIMPTTFVINSEGIISTVVEGGLQYDEMEELVKKLS